MEWGKRLAWVSMLSGGAYWLARYFRPKHSTLVLNEKVVLITGASSGVGRSLAYAFAQRAARVVLVARTPERLEAVRREIEPYTSQVMVIPADITQEDQLRSVVEQVIDRFGRIDVLVNNAGLAAGGPLVDHDPERMAALVRTNLWAAIRLTQLALPHMLANHHGYIMNISSVYGRVATPLFAPYSATKYGLAGFTDALRRELAGTGVHLTLVLPGWTSTDMLPPAVEEIGQRYGMRIDHPDTIAERAILGLVHGAHEVVLGGPAEKIGVWLERCAPVLLRLYWRFMMTPEWIDATKQVGTDQG